MKGLVKSCETGHATNIIQGLAVGYESTVAAALVIAGAILASTLVYANTNPTFIAFGVAMCGIGILTLTGDTISMDVFGPVADNANGIGEMGYDKKEMGEVKYKAARQILADLDAVGNTTKAITKGIAIGSAVIAAVSLSSTALSFPGRDPGERGEHAAVARRVHGRGESPYNIGSDAFHRHADRRRGAVSVQLDDHSGSGTSRVPDRERMPRAIPRQRDLGRDGETGLRPRCRHLHRGSAKELVGPGLLALLVPTFVAFALGTIALAGFLVGMIITGQLLAVFMANAGGAWDNAKKMGGRRAREP